MFNSALVYELSAIRMLAEPLLRQVIFGTPEYIEAKRLLAFLQWFLPIGEDLIPDNSILREFIGGSILKGFTLWQNGKHSTDYGSTGVLSRAELLSTVVLASWRSSTAGLEVVRKQRGPLWMTRHAKRLECVQLAGAVVTPACFEIRRKPAALAAAALGLRLAPVRSHWLFLRDIQKRAVPVFID